MAPSLADLEALAADAFARLPGHFRQLCDNLVIRVDDFPAEDVLDSMQAGEFDLLGMFQGVGLPFQSETAPAQLPNMIWLYRRPILDYWAEHEDTLSAIVTHVLVHEIGHHFGLSDDDIEAIEGAAEFRFAPLPLTRRFAELTAITRPRSSEIKQTHGKVHLLEGVAAPLRIINVDTDMIIPKQYLKTIKRTGLGKGLFSEQRYQDDGSENPDFVLNKPAYRNAKILVAGDNFGCGSSREHAPWALMDFGIRCVISTSFGDIFYNNCFKNGMLPIRVIARGPGKLFDDAERGANATLTIDLEKQEIRGPDGGVINFEIDAAPQALHAQRARRHRADQGRSRARSKATRQRRRRRGPGREARGGEACLTKFGRFIRSPGRRRAARRRSPESPARSAASTRPVRTAARSPGPGRSDRAGWWPRRSWRRARSAGSA